MTGEFVLMRFFTTDASNGWSRRRLLGAGAAGAGVLALGAGAATAFGEAPKAGGEGPPDPAEWELVEKKSDSFNSGGLDTEKWTTDYWHEHSRQFAFKDDNAKVDDGQLKLWAEEESYNNRKFTAGTVRSTFTVGGDSFVEVRAKMIPFAAKVNSAIWLHKRPKDGADHWAVEIDMQEYHLDSPKAGRTNIHSGFHLWKKKPDHHEIPDEPNPNEEDVKVNLDDDFHNYGVERRDGKVTFYFDGDPYWSVEATDLGPAYIATQPRHIILCCNGNAKTPVASELPDCMKVDYVRVYTRS
ncbi:MAG: glycoside hydrolase family 16 protein [Stackebrandtia sp.]